MQLEKKDIAVCLVLAAALYFVDFDKNAVKALVTGGVIGIWMSRKFR